MNAPNLDDLIGGDGRASRLSAAERAARQKEVMRRNNVATGLARKALVRLHNEDYRSLWAQAKAKVDAEFGPLPGDEPA